jgi:hypothetical protein
MIRLAILVSRRHQPQNHICITLLILLASEKSERENKLLREEDEGGQRVGAGKSCVLSLSCLILYLWRKDQEV